MNPLGKGEPGFVEPAAHLVCYTSRHCHFHLKASSAPCEGGCESGKGDGYAEYFESAVCVQCVENAGRFGDAESVAESVRTSVRCDGSALRRGPLFHNGPQSPRSHAVVDGSGKGSQ